MEKLSNFFFFFSGYNAECLLDNAARPAKNFFSGGVTNFNDISKSTHNRLALGLFRYHFIRRALRSDGDVSKKTVV